MRKLKTMVLLSVGILALAAQSFADDPPSTPYSLEYAIVSAGGASSSSANYSAVTVVQTEGVVLDKVQSPSYSIETLAGATQALGTNPVHLSGFSVE